MFPTLKNDFGPKRFWDFKGSPLLCQLNSEKYSKVSWCLTNPWLITLLRFYQRNLAKKGYFTKPIHWTSKMGAYALAKFPNYKNFDCRKRWCVQNPSTITSHSHLSLKLFFCLKSSQDHMPYNTNGRHFFFIFYWTKPERIMSTINIKGNISFGLILVFLCNCFRPLSILSFFNG